MAGAVWADAAPAVFIRCMTATRVNDAQTTIAISTTFTCLDSEQFLLRLALFTPTQKCRHCTCNHS
jgi:hypothetical protein